METVTMRDRAAWRKWLARHHESRSEIWLVYYKKHTGRASVGYAESVEEALCFGWIDGVRKRLDEDRYAHRFSPRRPGSRWSERNLARAEALIESGLMTPAGLAHFEARAKQDEHAPRAEDFELSDDFAQRLAKNRRAAKNFAALPPGQRNYYVAWIMSAKKLETREKRFAEALDLLERNERLGMK